MVSYLVKKETVLRSGKLADILIEMNRLLDVCIEREDVQDAAVDAYHLSYNNLHDLLKKVVDSDTANVLWANIDGEIIRIVEMDYLWDGGIPVIVDMPTIQEAIEDQNVDSLVGQSLRCELLTDHIERMRDELNVEPKTRGGIYKLIDELNLIKSCYGSILEISNKKSINDKIDLIKRSSDNEYFIETLRFVYDTFITTGVSFKTLDTTIDHFKLTDGIDISPISYLTLMDYVKNHNTGTLSTVALIQDYAMAFNDSEIKDFIYKVFSKDLKIGVTAKSINKALGKGFIPEFSVQLAHPYHKYSDRVSGKDFALTQKLDGHRAVCIVKNSKAQFFTRKGLPIEGLNVQCEEVLKLHSTLGNQDYVFDGELLLKNDDGLATKDLFRATTKVLRSNTADKSGVIFNMFDLLPLDEFLVGESKQVYVERRDKLNTINDQLADQLPHIHVVEMLYYGNDLAKIIELQKMAKNLGWEGLMLNIGDAPYLTKRTPYLLKIKEFLDADVVVKDIFEGTGNLEGKLGGVIIDYKGNDVKVGSGFTLEDRVHYWQCPEDIKDKVVQINYFEETHNQNNDDISLRFPTFVCVRRDKDKSEVSYEV